MKTLTGAEAVVFEKNGRIHKKRLPKTYRLPQLDAMLRKQRSRREAKILQRLSGIIRVPLLLEQTEDTLVLEKIHGVPLKDKLTASFCRKTGQKF